MVIKKIKLIFKYLNNINELKREINRQKIDLNYVKNQLKYYNQEGVITIYHIRSEITKLEKKGYKRNNLKIYVDYKTRDDILNIIFSKNYFSNCENKKFSDLNIDGVEIIVNDKISRWYVGVE